MGLRKTARDTRGNESPLRTFKLPQTREATTKASGPDTLTTATPALPGAVATAATVSFPLIENQES